MSETGIVKALSYINNLHPIQHRALSSIIESILSHFVPLFERVLSNTLSPEPPLAITVDPFGWYGDVPDSCDDIEAVERDMDETWPHVPDPAPFTPPSDEGRIELNLRGRCGRVRTTDGIKGSFVDYSEPGQDGRAPRRQDREGERRRSTMDSRTRRRTGGGVALDTTSPSHHRTSRSRPLPLTCTTSTTYLLRSLPVSNHVSLSLAHPFPLFLSLVLTPVFHSLTFSQRSMYDSTITPLPTDVYLGNAQRS